MLSLWPWFAKKAAFRLGKGTNPEIAQAVRDERARISRDLHDTTAQQIVLLKYNLESIRRQSLPGSTSMRLDQAIRDVDRLAVDLHATVSGLRSVTLEAAGLASALDVFVADWSRRIGIEAWLDVRGEATPMEPELETALFHVAQEALSNIMKHASTATWVSVILHCTDDRIVLSIEDNGKGFPPTGYADAGDHWGLIGLRERLALVGGALEITSRQDSGATLVASVPKGVEHHGFER